MNPTPASAAALVFTGERFTPESRGAIWYEHWHRYCAVMEMARGRRVLDAACGEGYGSALLAREAAIVFAVDVGAETIAHATSRYAMSNLNYLRASVTALPLASASVDVVVSFETIEHLAEQSEMLAEFRRVLTPGGILVISSPNRPVYNEGGEVANAFHVRELDRSELKSLLDIGFPRQDWYAQRVLAHSLLWNEADPATDSTFDVLTDSGPSRQREPAAPMYFIVVCARDDVPLPKLPSLSIFDDGRLSLWQEFARIAKRERQLVWDELDARKIAEDRLTELVASVNALRGAREGAQALRRSLEETQAILDQTRITLDRTQLDLAHEANAHRDARERLAFRESLIGWLRWPLSVARRWFAVASTESR